MYLVNIFVLFTLDYSMLLYVSALIYLFYEIYSGLTGKVIISKQFSLFYRKSYRLLFTILCFHLFFFAQLLKKFSMWVNLRIYFSNLYSEMIILSIYILPLVLTIPLIRDKLPYFYSLEERIMIVSPIKRLILPFLAVLFHVITVSIVYINATFILLNHSNLVSINFHPNIIIYATLLLGFSIYCLYTYRKKAIENNYCIYLSVYFIGIANSILLVILYTQYRFIPYVQFSILSIFYFLAFFILFLTIYFFIKDLRSDKTRRLIYY
jgi:hypothetical protein